MTFSTTATALNSVANNTRLRNIFQHIFPATSITVDQHPNHLTDQTNYVIKIYDPSTQQETRYTFVTPAGICEREQLLYYIKDQLPELFL